MHQFSFLHNQGHHIAKHISQGSYQLAHHFPSRAISVQSSFLCHWNPHSIICYFMRMQKGSSCCGPSTFHAPRIFLRNQAGQCQALCDEFVPRTLSIVCVSWIVDEVQPPAMNGGMTSTASKPFFTQIQSLLEWIPPLFRRTALSCGTETCSSITTLSSHWHRKIQWSTVERFDIHGLTIVYQRPLTLSVLNFPNANKVKHLPLHTWNTRAT